MMKQVNNLGVSRLFFSTLVCLAFALSSPRADPSPETHTPADSRNQVRLHTDTGQSHAHERTIYACPMHGDEISDQPGSCSICGMFLVAQEIHDNDEDHPTHGAMAPVTAGQPPGAMAEGEMSHGRMPLAPEHRPTLFWESEITERAGTPGRPVSNQHEHPVARAVPPGSPGAATTVKGGMPEDPARILDETAVEHAQKHLDPSYVCPMHPRIMQDGPGSCPICGMDLVSKQRVAPGDEHPQVFLPAAVIQNMGVRTTEVHRRSLGKEIRTQGIVRPDDDRIRNIHPRAGGWIDTLYLLTEGDRVERKHVIADFYSPWINQAQLDFITALEEYDLVSFDPSRKTELAAKVDSARNSLRLLRVSPMDIMRVENSRKVQSTVQLITPNGGLVTELNVREGAYVEPYQSMFTVVDLSEVWVMVDIYEHQAPWVRKGNPAEITVPAIPGRTWNGVVEFIYPEVDPKARTLRARIEVHNPDEALLLNMFVQVDLSASASRHEVLTVPRDAVIVTGEREVVVKSMGKGHFQPVEVSTGIWSGAWAEIRSGLDEGDEIVVSGQFLIDSESSLQASFLRMSE